MEEKPKVRKSAKRESGYNPLAVNQFGFQRYTQDSEEHQKGYFIALNARFPNLVGFGIVQYIKQLMAMNPRGKVMWDNDNIQVLCLQMNVEEKTFREVIDYCIKTLKIMKLTHTWHRLEMTDNKFLVFPDFQDELIRLEIQKLRDEAAGEINEVKMSMGGETPSAKRHRLIKEIKDILILTPEIKQIIINYYPKLGTPEDLWSRFIDDVELKYLKWHAIITPENYDKLVYTFLNNMKASPQELEEGYL